LQLDLALEQGTYLAFAYTPLGQSWDAPPIQHTRIEPYELEYREGHWYFTAYLLEQESFVDYRVDRIRPASLQVADTRDRFTPGVRSRHGTKIRYWVSPMLARHGSLSARLREQKVTLLDEEQGAIVEGYAKSIWWARRLLLGYGAQVKALEPAELVQTIQREIEAMGNLYEKEAT
jgi:predicted DNA-binding transcriptional regulator YafY